jgi:hypothetical protein
MTRPGETRVTVRVEVVVEGHGEAPSVTTVSAPATTTRKGGVRPLEIIHPSGSGPVPVFAFGGNLCIEADGTAPTLEGSYPGKVYAKVYPDPNLDCKSSGLAVPPSDAVSDVPNQTDGTWSFTQAKGNPVPGATCANSGANNNTLVVWYFYGSGIPCSIECKPFQGVCVSGGARAGWPPSPPATLHATFTGALAALGTVALTSNGPSWFGVSSACGGAFLAFLGAGEAYSLLSAGPGVAFAVGNSANSCDPFEWSGSGTAMGSCAGVFNVTITE